MLLDDRRSISQNVALLNILVHDLVNLLYYVNTEQTSKHIFTHKRFMKVYDLC